MPTDPSWVGVTAIGRRSSRTSSPSRAGDCLAPVPEPQSARAHSVHITSETSGQRWQPTEREMPEFPGFSLMYRSPAGAVIVPRLQGGSPARLGSGDGERHLGEDPVA